MTKEEQLKLAQERSTTANLENTNSSNRTQFCLTDVKPDIPLRGC